VVTFPQGPSGRDRSTRARSSRRFPGLGCDDELYEGAMRLACSTSRPRLDVQRRLKVATPRRAAFGSPRGRGGRRPVRGRQRGEVFSPTDRGPPLARLEVAERHVIEPIALAPPRRAGGTSRPGRARDPGCAKNLVDSEIMGLMARAASFSPRPAAAEVAVGTAVHRTVQRNRSIAFWSWLP